jgi:hypothetical protein
MRSAAATAARKSRRPRPGAPLGNIANSLSNRQPPFVEGIRQKG